MLPEKVESKIREIIQTTNPAVFVVDLALHQSKRSLLSIILETEEGITMPECAKISRAISKYLDEESPLDFAFNLEVSSPGLGKPILVPRQYIRHLGKKLRVKFSTGDKAEGFLQGFDEQGIKLKTLPVKKEKKQVTEEEIFIPFTDIKEAIVLVSFN